MKKILCFLGLSFMLLSLCACGSSLITEDSLEVTYGEKLKINVNTDEVFTWEVENEDILIVDEKGNVTTTGVGTTVVKVLVGRKTDTVIVEVLSDLVLSYSSLELQLTQVREITCFTKQEGEIVWSSTNEDVAILSKDFGDLNYNTYLIIETLSIGQTRITATLGEQSVSCVLHVV